jgi:hypothetical protein
MLFRHQATILLLSVGLAYSSSGCTLIGFGIGATFDSSYSRTLAPETFSPDTIMPRNRVTLKLKDGRKVSGWYGGLEAVSEDAYAERYSRSRENHLPDFPLPQLSDSVSLHLRSGERVDAEFAGFDYGGTVIVRSGEVRRLAAADVTGLADCDGDTISGEVLRELLTASTIPLRSAFVIYVSGSETEEIPMERVAVIERRSGTGRVLGTIAGLAIDIAVVAACTASDCLDLDMGGNWNWQSSAPAQRH